MDYTHKFEQALSAIEAQESAERTAALGRAKVNVERSVHVLSGATTSSNNTEESKENILYRSAETPSTLTGSNDTRVNQISPPTANTAASTNPLFPVVENSALEADARRQLEELSETA